MSRDDALITQLALCAALLSFILLMMNHAMFDRALLHSFLVFVFTYSFSYGVYLLYHKAKHRLHRMEIEEQKRLAAEQRKMREGERSRSASERLGLE
jgi:hypothetical protein